MAKGLLIIRTLTPTHPGAGASVGAIDLMLQREVTTEFPFIQGSSLKGAIRRYLESLPVGNSNKNLAQQLINQVLNSQEVESKEKEKIKRFQNEPEKLPVYKARELVEKLIAGEKDENNRKNLEKQYKSLYEVYDKVFGPYTSSGEFVKGSLIISDASLLFYPVRTLKGLYALVTCPEILRRLNMPHINLLTKNSKNLLEWDDKEKVLPLGADIKNFRIGDRVYFEDLNFAIDSNSIDTSWINDLPIENEDKSRIFLVHDDVFQYFVKFATQIVSRNRISYETGVVETGALWTEEHLPPETYLFSYLEDDEKPVEDSGKTAFLWISAKINPEDSQKYLVIHLGGDETVGKGFVELRVKELNGGQ